MVVRPAGDEDATRLYELSVAAIDQSAAGHYDERQRAAWAGRRDPQGHRWMIRETHVLVAVVDGEVAGFASLALRPVGHLEAGEVDQLFVDPRSGGRGVARRLLEAVAAAAADAGLPELLTHASWRAKPAFEALGYRQAAVETVDVDGVRLTRALMRRSVGQS